ncbi:MAG: hypothetical protein KA419_12095 [Acidobacteria bacterium]|nr:hypothetical protein [Acidobacteriota bacterium]
MRWIGIGILVGMVMAMARGAEPPAPSSTAVLWDEVKKAVDAGLPKTAVEKLDLILQKTAATQKWGEWLKALGRKITLDAVIQGNRPEEKVGRLKTAMEKAPKELLPILRTVLAEWFWQYYQRNRWRFMNRSATEGGASEDFTSEDFTTWDLPKLFREIDGLYTRVLAEEDLLKKTPLSTLKDFLEPGALDGKLRPTLFDFVAFEALDFYTSAEQAKAQPEDAFAIDAASPAFASWKDFLAWEPKTADADSPKVKALALYRKLIAFHRGDADPSARIDADLHRLVYLKNEAYGEGKVGTFLQRLEELASAHPGVPVTALVRFYQAKALEDEGERVKALRVALDTEKAFPGTPGAQACRCVADRIRMKTATIGGERTIPPEKGSLEVRYKNFDKLYLRVVADDWKAFTRRKWGHPNQLEDDRFQTLLAARPVAEWSVSLPATPDYTERVHPVEVPALKPGYYRLLVSWQPDFRNSSMLQTAWVWVSRHTLVRRLRQGAVEGFVLDAVSGEPVPGATVSLMVRQNEYYHFTAKTTSGPDGFFDLSSPSLGYDSHLHVEKDGEELFDAQNVYPDRQGVPEPRDQAVFFTDRALYRPGQTIYFKTILVRVDDAGRNYTVLPGRPVTVVLRDPNGQEAGRLFLVTNDFGSASGQFTVPSGRLTGLMTLLAESCQGSDQFRVEEYKRPKFRVEMETPKTAFKLGDTVEVKGKALAYTGAAVDGAGVRYRVVRLARYPYWWEWFHGPARSASQEIAHGKVKTGPDGSFSVTFPARPDRSIPESDGPTFAFQVFADVTDTAGETRSGQATVNLGYAALALRLEAKSLLTGGERFPLKVYAETLDGNPLSAEGTVTVYALKQPEKPVRAPLGSPWSWMPAGDGTGSSVWQRWPQGNQAEQAPFFVKDKPVEVSLALPPGLYRAEVVSRDAYGKEVKALLPLQVLPAWDGEKFGLKLPSVAVARDAAVPVGGTADVLWGTGYDSGRCVVEVEHDGKVRERHWSRPGTTQHRVKVPVGEAFRGGFAVRVTYVRENRNYTTVLPFSVPWDNKDLELSFETFREKMQPGAKETFVVRVKGKKADVKAAEMVAALYDASLDQFYAHAWPGFSFYHQDRYPPWTVFTNARQDFNLWRETWNSFERMPELTYVHFPQEISQSLFSFGFPGGEGQRRYKSARPRNGDTGAVPEAMPAPPPAPSVAAPMAEAAPATLDAAADKGGAADDENQPGQAPAAAPKPDLGDVKARENLNETAFFFPSLVMEADGTVAMAFTMPEALTEWKFLGFAHTADCMRGALTGTTVTQKDLMVQPNPPRFLREGDEIEFTAKVTSLAENPLEGIVRLEFADLLTGRPVSEALGLAETDRAFHLDPKSSNAFSWRLKVPVGQGPLTYTVRAKAGDFSDGEAGSLPVLSGRVFVTESVPLWVRGPETRKFAFPRLGEIGTSPGLAPAGLTVQMASNPAWYAVQALPFLMEFPFECAEQIFHRLYANTLAQRVALSNPRIRQIFEAWRGTDALKSNLEKHQELKSVLLEETPWVLDAKKESQSKRNVGLYFEPNTVEANLASAREKLANMQLSNGAWPWFPGGRPSPWVTLVVVTGYGKLRRFGADLDVSMAVKALDYLDDWLAERYRQIPKKDRPLNHLSHDIAAYLHGRSFFLKDKPVAAGSQEALAYFLGQAKQHWLKLNSRMSQGHLAIALKRFGDPVTAGGIMASLKERSVTSEELGTFWREDELSWWWWRAPIETQAVMIEAFDEVCADAKTVEDCQVWLLKQKQTQAWKTTTGTADAVYALLLKGQDLLSDSEPVEVTLGTTEVKPEKIEPGTGFYEVRYDGPAVKPEFADVSVKKVTKGIAWGGVHFQYFQDLSAVTAHETNLKLEKALFVNRDTPRGPVIEPVTGPLQVGDLVTVRITLRTDRDMEFVHLKDGRGSGMEPTSVLSGYRFQDGLAYYQSTRDTASHFFIDYLPKGTYVFEYTLRVQLRGKYPSGLAEIQCMYAPEFNSHSASVPMEVK